MGFLVLLPLFLCYHYLVIHYAPSLISPPPLTDELIRQVTIESPERGLLLLRVRDEVRMTIAAYQTLYESSITFGMRKALQAEQGNTELQNNIEDLNKDISDLKAELQDMNGLKAAIEKVGIALLLSVS